MRCGHDRRGNALADSARPPIQLAPIHNGRFEDGTGEKTSRCHTLRTRLQDGQSPRAPHSKEIPMFRNLFGKKATRKSASARTTRFRASQYDALEDRLAMSLPGGPTGGLVPIPIPIVFLPCGNGSQPHRRAPRRGHGRSLSGIHDLPSIFPFQLQQGRLSASRSQCPGDRKCRVSDEHPEQQRDGAGYERPRRTLRVPAQPRQAAHTTPKVTGSVSGLIPLGSYELDLHRLALAPGNAERGDLGRGGFHVRLACGQYARHHRPDRLWLRHYRQLAADDQHRRQRAGLLDLHRHRHAGAANRRRSPSRLGIAAEVPSAR